MNREQVLSGNAGLTGVHWALNGSAARRLIRGQIQEIVSEGTRIGPLHLTRAKYKPGRKLSAFYTFTLLPPDDEAGRSVPAAVTWEEAFSPAAAEDFHAMQAEANQRGLAAPFTQLWNELPEWGLRVRIWPLDPGFPQLVRVGDPEYSRDFFQPAGVHSPDGYEAHWKVTPIRYRPGERHVLRFDLQPGIRQPGQSYRLYAKLYRDAEDAARTYRIANRVVDWLGDHLHGFRGVRPAGWSAEDAAVIYPHAPGEPLSRQLRRSAGWVKAQMRTVGEALDVLHSGPAELAAELEENPFEQELKAVRRASEHIRILIPETGRQITELLDQAQTLHSRMPPEAPTFTHSDFKADHLLAGADGLTLIDFDTCALADPALDAGKFLADLDWWYGRTGAAGLEDAQAAFLEGYSGGKQNPRTARARVYEALILVKITARRAPIFSQDWEVITVRMIERARQVLRGVEERA